MLDYEYLSLKKSRNLKSINILNFFFIANSGGTERICVWYNKIDINQIQIYYLWEMYYMHFLLSVKWEFFGSKWQKSNLN